MIPELNTIKKAGGIIIVIAMIIAVLRWLIPKNPVGAHVIPPVDNSQLRPGILYGSYATDLYNAFNGIDWTSTKARAIERTVGLNDEEFKQVYKIYNDLYTEAPATLKTDAQGEWIWGSLITEFINRLERLNLP